MTHNREYIFSQDNIQTVQDFVNRLNDICRYDGTRLITVKDRDGKTDHFEIDASQKKKKKWIVYDLDDCLHLVCSDVFILGTMFDYKYVVFKP